MALRPATVLELCAGYGGLGVGVAIACPGIRVVGAVERQAYPAAVLASRMVEGSVDPCPIFDDLESFDGGAYRGRVDLVVAGFPCQGASVAGKRLGVDDARWLWPEVWRVTIECGAAWLFLENVPGLLTVNGGRAFKQILDDLCACGWDAEWDCVPAAAVGAPHLRDRVFLFAADPQRVSVRLEPERDQRRGRGERTTEREPAARERSDARIAVDAGEGRQGGTDVGRGDQPARAARPTTDADDTRHREVWHGSERGPLGENRSTHRGDADRRGSAWTRYAIEGIVADSAEHWRWDRAPFPTIRGVDDGTSIGVGIDTAYADELHLLGNGVVPQAVALAFVILWDRLHGTALMDDADADATDAR